MLRRARVALFLLGFAVGGTGSRAQLVPHVIPQTWRAPGPPMVHRSAVPAAASKRIKAPTSQFAARTQVPLSDPTRLVGKKAAEGKLMDVLDESKDPTHLLKARIAASDRSPGRRGTLLAAAVTASVAAGSIDSAEGFDNAVKQRKRDINDPKRKGPQPEELGLAVRLNSNNEPAMKECLENSPNCLSTTGNEIDVGYHTIDPWKFSKSKADALQDVENVIAAYPPGQRGIDGGGFKVIAKDETCIYIQFESLKRGHIDDVEFCVAPEKEGVLLLRSASRLGFWDFGVNAIRLNRIAQDLEKVGGWKTAIVDPKSHPRYWQMNCQGGVTRKAPFVTADKFPEMCPE